MDFAKSFLAPQLPVYAGLAQIMFINAVVFSVLNSLPGQACNPGRKWYNTPDLKTDVFYILVNPLFLSFLAPLPLLAIVLVARQFFPGAKIEDYLLNGGGPLGRFSMTYQFLIVIFASDFLMYWIHRASHTRLLWRFHRIHHSAKDVDWTTVNRIHPISFLIENVTVINILILAGISKEAIALASPLLVAWFYFAHTNLQWRLEPFERVLVSPVLHRWHHTKSLAGGNKNFGGLLAIWDLLFGTFFLPDNLLPEDYGLDDNNFPIQPMPQLLSPFLPDVSWSNS